jgi:hypothetical protein
MTPETRKTATSVLKILEPLLGHGHRLKMDNFYNCSELARQLKVEHSIDYVGHSYLRNVTKEEKNKKLNKDEILARHSGPVKTLNWCDKSKCNSGVNIPQCRHAEGFQERKQHREILVCNYFNHTGEST